MQTNSEGVKVKELYFIYLAILRKAANHVALLQSTAGTSKKQVKTWRPVTDLVYMFNAIVDTLSRLSSSDSLDSQLRLICLFKEKYVGAICAKVFQRFPDFVQRHKNESFEALSDPVYSGKMKVQFVTKNLVASSLGFFTAAEYICIHFPLGFAEAAQILPAEGG